MKNFQQNLLILLALGLCGLCAWQWYVQTQLHSAGQSLQEVIYKQGLEIEGYTNSIKNMDAEIAGLSTHVNELKQAALTNEQVAAGQKREIQRLSNYNLSMSNEITLYTGVVEKMEAQLKEASAGIEKQNSAFNKLVAERDDAIKKYNDSMKERNALVEKYNALVERVNKLQASGATEGAK